MKKILIATHNKAKFLEIKKGLKKYLKVPIDIIELDDLKISSEPEESGKTFEENAKIKIQFYAQLTKLPIIADDAGLVIPFLNNEPGVKSRRWLGIKSTDDELIDHTLSHLRGEIWANRTAYLEVFLCFFNPKTSDINCVCEKIKGHIALKPSEKRTEGYPYRALFVVDKFNKYFDELTEEEHDEVNHRLKAIKKVVKKIESLI